MQSSTRVDRPNLAPAIALCYALCCVVLLEFALRIMLTYAPGRMKIFAIQEVGWTFLPICLGLQWIVRGLGFKGTATAIAVATIAYISMIQFRGLWVWAGTFDAYWLPAASWTYPAMGGLILGGIFSSRLFKPWVPKVAGLALWPICLVAAGGIEYLGCRQFNGQIDSVYAPTRSVVLLASSIVLAAGCLHVWRSE